MAKVHSAAAASGFAKGFASWGLNAPLAGAMAHNQVRIVYLNLKEGPWPFSSLWSMLEVPPSRMEIPLAYVYFTIAIFLKMPEMFGFCKFWDYSEEISQKIA